MLFWKYAKIKFKPLHYLWLIVAIFDPYKF